MKYKRVLIKLSGEFLGDGTGGFSPAAAEKTAKEIASSISGVQTAVLVGGGNIVRARSCSAVDRLSADYMGMAATLINALGLKDALEKNGCRSKLLSALSLEGAVERFNSSKAEEYLNDGRVLILAGGTGLPFFTTDTAAALRALEIKAQALLKATNVDGIYDRDPQKYRDARLVTEKLSIDQALERKLEIMDASAFSILRGSGMEVMVFNFSKKGRLKKVLEGASGLCSFVK